VDANRHSHLCWAHSVNFPASIQTLNEIHPPHWTILRSTSGAKAEFRIKISLSDFVNDEEYQDD
jgi:hypothetical protein